MRRSAFSRAFPNRRRLFLFPNRRASWWPVRFALACLGLVFIVLLLIEIL